jgi:SPP1 family predicted phage head-tail adaptor
MINFGKYDQKVEFITFSPVTDGAGGTIISPSTSLSTFASVTQTRGGNGLEAGEMVLPNTLQIAIQHRVSFIPSENYQVYYRNRYYKITGVQLDEQRQHKEYIINMVGV